MIHKYKHIIWDWNGTLLDDVELCLDIINGILSRRNIKTLSLDDYREIFTFPVKDYYAKAGLDFGVYPFEELGTEWIEEYEKRKGECRLFNGAEDVLKLLSRNGSDQSLLSAYSHDTLVEIVGGFKLDSYFKYLSGLDHIYATSKVDLGKELIKKLNPKKGKVLLIGDTIHDYEVSKEIGTDCLLIAAGHQNKKRLESCGVPVLGNILDIF
jgi:phosphoglycolate phosphatase